MHSVLIGAAVLVAAISPLDNAEAQPDAVGQQSNDPTAFFVLGNLEYILLHELAHLLISDLDVPVIGSEESAADYIATGTLIRADRFDSAGVERARQFLLATADGLATSWDFLSGSGAELQFWDSHSLTIQRFYQIICLIYGSNQEEFSALPARVGMPESRAARCPAEFERADRSLQWLLDNFGRSDDDDAGAEITVVFDQAPTRISQRVMDELVASRMLDNLISRLREQFIISNRFSIAFRQCRQPQAIWYPQEREITVCYALLDAYYALGSTRGAERRLLESDRGSGP